MTRLWVGPGFCASDGGGFVKGCGFTHKAEFRWPTSDPVSSAWGARQRFGSG
jgi:hypothetical protein